MHAPLRALIVEDSPDDAALVVLELKRGGFDVNHLRVDSGPAMHAALDAGQWDVVISDYSMPGFSGEEALKILRAKNSEMPFLFVSGTIGEETAVTALKSGAQDYLVKGKLTRLVPAIERELRDAEARRERKRLEIQVHQLQRFEAIGRLAGGIAHDFNNVIGAILGYAEIAQTELPENHRTRDRLQKICDQADRARNLTHQLLAFARRQVLQPQNLDLNALIRSTVKFLATIIGEKIQIELEPSAALDPAWADATQVEQVLMNLCLNARDAMPQGGRILIQTQMTEIHPKEAALRPYYRPGRYTLLKIADTGSGMDAETLEHIFEPFFTTKEVGKGTGLGLATVYGIVKQHGGIIDVESEPGVGTEFRVYLPAGTGSVQAVDKKPVAAVERGTETILVAEDHEGLREMAQEVLESLGYRVLVAATGAQAIEVFERNRSAVDLVLLDVVMPTLNGPEAFAKMSALKPGLRAIFTTGYTSEERSLRSTMGDGVLIMHKPYAPSELGQQIRALLDETVRHRS